MTRVGVALVLMVSCIGCAHEAVDGPRLAPNGVPLAPGVTCSEPDCRGYTVSPQVRERSRYGIGCLGNVSPGTTPNPESPPKSYALDDISRPGVPKASAAERAMARRIRLYDRSKTLRFARINDTTTPGNFIVFDAVDGPCDDSRPTCGDKISEYAIGVEAYAKRHGGHAETVVAAPATSREIAVCESSLGYRLPDDYRRFLGECGGFASCIYGPNGLPMYEVDIYGTVRLVEERTRMLAFQEEYADQVDYDEFVRLILFSGPREAPLKHFLQSLGDDRWQIVLRDYGSGDFLSDDYPVLATSFDEYLASTLDSMRDGRGPYYYEDPSLVEDIRRY